MPVPMLMLRGELRNVYTNPERKFGDQVRDAQDRVQLLCEIPLEDGGLKEDLVDLKTSDVSLFQPMRREWISVPVGVFATKEGRIVYFLQRGGVPERFAP